MLSFAHGLSAPSLIWFFLSINARSLQEKEGGQQADGRTASSIARAGGGRGREQKGGLKETGKLVTEGRASRRCVGVFFVHTGDCSVSVCLSPGCSCSYYIWSFYTIQHCLWGMCCLQLIGKCPPLHPAITLTISSPWLLCCPRWQLALPEWKSWSWQYRIRGSGAELLSEGCVLFLWLRHSHGVTLTL